MGCIRLEYAILEVHGTAVVVKAGAIGGEPVDDRKVDRGEIDVGTHIQNSNPVAPAED
jgi:hypothetical protein